MSTVTARVAMDDSRFQSGVSRIQRNLRLVRSEFSEASSRANVFGSATEALRVRSDSLNRQILLQRQLVESLNSSYSEYVERNQASSRGAENLRTRINRANAELNNMQRQLTETNTRLNGMGWERLSRRLDVAGQKLRAMGQQMSMVGLGLSAAVTLPLIGVGTAATKMAMDAVESENLFEVSMGKMAKEARKWSEDVSKSLGLNAYAVRKSVATYNAMLTSMGLTEKESLNMSESLTELSYDMASFYNLNPEEAFNKLKAGITGEAEPLKELGILVTDNTIKTYAYKNGIAKLGKELTESQKVQARYGVIMQTTKKAQGDLGRTLDSPTNKLRVMKEQVTQIGIQFGQLLIPILEKLMKFVKPMLDKFQNMSEAQKDLVIKIGLVVAALGPFLLIFGKVIAIAGALSSAFSIVSGIIATAGGSAAAFSAVIAAITGPVGIAIAVIGGLVAVFVALYKRNTEFRNNVNTIWNQIKQIVGEVVESLKLIIAEFVEVGKKYWDKYGDDIITILSKAFNVIATVVNAALTTLKNIMNIVLKLIQGDWKGVWEGIKTLVVDNLDNTVKVINSVLDYLIHLFAHKIKKMIDIFKMFFPKLKSIFKTGFNAVSKVSDTIWGFIIKNILNSVNRLKTALSNILSAIKKLLQGNWKGALKDATKAWDNINKAMLDPVINAKKAIDEQIKKIVAAFSKMKIKLPKIKLPHFNIKGGFKLDPPSTPKMSVNWYAKGGIFNRPSIIGVGEVGEEAVLPIDRIDDLIAKAMAKVENKENKAQLVLHIENFINNTDKDIEELAHELEFYRQRLSIGKGGV